MDSDKPSSNLQERFLETYDAHADAIFRFCLVKVSNRERAQDITQETFMRYWQTLRTGESIKNHRAYLYTVSRNLITDWYRRKKETSLDALMETGLEFTGVVDADITRHAEATEVLAVMQELDDDSREVLVLRFVDGLSPKEIAKTLKLTPNVVSVRIHRGLKKIQERIHAHE